MSKLNNRFIKLHMIIVVIVVAEYRNIAWKKIAKFRHLVSDSGGEELANT
jgi:hypothetical protein